MAAALVGHAVEWYEFSIYGVLAAYVAAAVFPSSDGLWSLTLTWIAFAGAFFVRPLGGLLLAGLADRSGRRRALYTGVALMTAATTAIAVVPETAVAGAIAPVLFVGLRLVQGFAVGGEMGSAVPYVIESVPSRRRARAVSLLAAGTFAAALSGALVAAVLSALLTTEQMNSWGWRVPFLLALPLGVCALAVRRSAPESPEYLRLVATGSRERSPMRTAIRVHWASVLELAGISLAFNVVLAAALTGYLTEVLVLGFSPAQALLVSVAGYAALIVAILCFAPLVDAIGRRRTLMMGALGAVALVMPQIEMARSGAAELTILGALLLAVPAGILATPVYLALGELFPAHVRATAAALGFNAATAVASLVPVITLSLRRSGYQDGMALCVFGAAAICFATVLVSNAAAKPHVE